MAEPDVVVDLISSGLAWAILRRYASTIGSAGSQLGSAGVGRASSAATNAAATVGQKLERCPLVARVLWLDVAADVVRNVIRPQLARGGKNLELACERREVIDVLFEYQVGLSHTRNHDQAMQRDAQRLEESGNFREQWTLMLCELSACWQDDAAFRGWMERT